MKKILRKILIIIGIIVAIPVAITIAYYSFLFVAHDFSIDFLHIDSCLDVGGAWNYENKICHQ